ncbi:MAG TPA: cupredoxin domain-containing protein [Frankiaceae bacterium]|nr:cupredoxin domain-containing protein [Frankiaceae bacterium]
MFLRRRALAATFAAVAAFSLAACVEADNGNNTLADQSQAPAASSTAPGAPQSTAPAEPQGDGPIDLEAKDNVFAPEKITAAAGQIVIKMRNTGVAPHTFTNTDLKVDVNANGGQDAEIKLAGVKPGTYKFICKYHEALNPPMVGELTVT